MRVIIRLTEKACDYAAFYLRNYQDIYFGRSHLWKLSQPNKVNVCIKQWNKSEMVNINMLFCNVTCRCFYFGKNRSWFACFELKVRGEDKRVLCCVVGKITSGDRHRFPKCCMIAVLLKQVRVFSLLHKCWLKFCKLLQFLLLRLSYFILPQMDTAPLTLVCWWFGKSH